MEIFETWTLYDQILDLNLMFHEEIFAEVHAILAERFGDRAIGLIDLGCGSARHTSAALKGLRVARFVGYDLSAAALDGARRNLAGIVGSVDLRLGDLLEGLDDGEDRYDVVFTSFAIHHLSVEDKARFFRKAADRLESGGLLVLIDTTRDEGEDRATYLDHYERWIRTDWNVLPEAALDSIIDHIRECDFPEMASTLDAMANDASLGRLGGERKFGRHQLFAYEPTAKPGQSA